MAAEVPVVVAAVGGDDQHVAEAFLLQHLPQVGCVLAEAAGARSARHEESDLLWVRAGPAADTQEVTERDLVR